MPIAMHNIMHMDQNNPKALIKDNKVHQIIIYSIQVEPFVSWWQEESLS